MPGLFRNRPDTREGKYPVLLRRDGTVPEWEHFCLGARDPAAPDAIRAYSRECERRNMDPDYVRDLLAMALSWEESQQDEAEKWARSEAATTPHDKQLPWGFADPPPAKKADPDGPRHRKDDPDVLAFPNTLAEYRAKVRAEAFEEAGALCCEESAILYALSCATHSAAGGPENAAASGALRDIAGKIRALAESDE